MKKSVQERHFGPVWFIPGEDNGIYPNCHSIYIEGDGVLIDPASNRERLVQLREDPGVREIWLTHWHEDHFMHLDLFDDLPLLISEPDEPPLTDLDVFMDAYGMEDADEREYWRSALKEQFHYRPRRATRFLRNGDIIRLKTGDVEVLATPGHTPGHLSFFFQAHGALLLGDYDLTRFGPWYGDRGSSIQETILSVNRLRDVPAYIWLSSHEQGVFEEDPGDRWDQYVAVIHEREKKLVQRLQTPRTLQDIVEAWIIYGRPREPKAFFEFGERVHMKKHLEKLMNEGRVVKDGPYYAMSQ
ncbi:MAG: hydroxyacylglutathione hydrolase [Thermodesulfobacteriota bacterium]|nr:hydroxyacylglutathione hydrolase [Thermodesulfobacteriota bacterium]